MSFTQNLPVIVATVGDFNGDGIPDLACSLYSIGRILTSTVTILLGKGDGTFQSLAGFPIPNASFYLAVGDFNGDGKADIVAADLIAGVDVMFGRGDGTFLAPVSYPNGPQGGSGAEFVLVADLNGDGNTDIATILRGFQISILLGTGNGTFQPPALTSVANEISSLAAGDFNGDGKPDLVTSNADVLLGKGDGTFQNSVSYSNQPLPAVLLTGGSLVAVGDFNGDGKPDFVIPSSGGFTQDFEILFGNGDGTFQLPVIVASASQFFAGSLLVGEFNGDGITDLAVSAASSPSTVKFFLGSAKSITPTAGTPQSTTATTSFPTALQVTVKDGANPVSGVTVTFTPPAGPDYIPSAVLSSGTAVTDANGVASVRATANSAAGTYSVAATALGVSTGFLLTNVATVPAHIQGSPTTPQSALVGLVFPSSLVVTVTDAAGVPVGGMTINFTVATSGASAVLSQPSVVTNASGVASVTATANYIPGSYTVTASNFFSGKSLSVTFPLTNLQATTTPVTLVTSANPSNFGAPVTLTATVANPGAHARMTFFDGVTPLGAKPVTSAATSFSTVLLSAGIHKLTAYYRDEANLIVGTSNAVTQTVKAVAGGAFIPGNPVGVTVQSVTPASLPVVVADFNHDGKVDFALPRSVSGFGNAVTVVLGNGDGTFQPPVNYAIGTSTPISIVAADFDGDGNTDLVAAAFSGGNTLSVLLGNGDGTFRSATNIMAGNFSSMVVSDFKGKADLIFAMGGSRGELDSPVRTYYAFLELVPGNGDGTLGAPKLYANLPGTSFNPTDLNPVFAVADFNGDGKADVVATTGFAGPAIFLGNGDNTAQAPVNINVGGTRVVTILAGDFNGDGEMDLAVGGIAGTNVATTTILLGNGDGTFQAPVSYPFGTARASGDFNGDGFTDFVITNSSGNTVGILQGKGDGTFQLGPAFSADAPLLVTDFNGDGKADIFTININSGSFTVLLGVTPSTNPPASITATSGTPQSAVLGAAFPNPLQVTVRDASGLPVAGASVTFTAPASGAGATLSSASAVTTAFGVASVTATANNIPGNYQVTAKVGTLSTTFSLTNLSAGSSDLALGKTATQSSTLPGYATTMASSAVDGNTDGSFYNGSVTATNLETSPWWQVDLGASAVIGSVVVWNRTDCCGSRLSDYWVFISDTPFQPTDTPAALQNRAGTFSSHQTTAPNASTMIVAGAQGRYVRVQLSGTDYLSLAEVQVFAGTNVAQGKPATESNPFVGATAAVDGSTDGNYYDHSVATTEPGPNAWWQVELGASTAISSVVVWNRTDCCGERLSDYWVFISDTPFLPTDTPNTLQNRAGTFSSHQTTAPHPSTLIVAPTQGRYVWVQLSGTDYLSLAEVQVFAVAASAPTNLAQGRTATQSSTLAGYPTAAATAAVDGNTDGAFFDDSVTATNSEATPWWQVDLGAPATVSSIVIWNRTDGCCVNRLGDYWVFVSDTPFLSTDTPATLQNRAGTFSSHQTTAPTPATTILVGAQGSYVRVQLSGTDYLSLAEVQVLGSGGAPAPTDLALGKATAQSTTYSAYLSAASGSAVDGNMDGAFFDGSVTATFADPNAWWQVDLGSAVTISSVVIWNRTDACCANRLSDYWVFVSNTPFLATDTPATLQNQAGVFSSHQTTAPAPSTTVQVGAQGRYVRVQLSGTDYLSLAEVQVYGQ